MGERGERERVREREGGGERERKRREGRREREKRREGGGGQHTCICKCVSILFLQATPDLRTVNSLTPTLHMIANQSHDSRMTSSPITATPSTPPFQRQHSSDAAVPVQGEEYPHNIYSHDDLEQHPPTTLPGLTQYALDSAVHGDSSTVPGLTHYPLNSDLNMHTHDGTEHFLPSSTFSGLTQYPPNSGTPTYTSGMVSSNQAPFIQHQSQPGATHHMEELGGERVLTSYNAPAPNDDTPVSLDPHVRVPQEKSDVFAGTSQAYGAPTNIQHAHNVHEEGYFIRQPNVLNHEPALESLTVASHEGGYQDQDPIATTAGSRELDVLSPSLQQMGLRQLGVLFKARGRHIAELTQQISAQAEDNERHVGILKHEKVSIA